MFRCAGALAKQPVQGVAQEVIIYDEDNWLLAALWGFHWPTGRLPGN
jgi:hypothetical protein